MGKIKKTKFETPEYPHFSNPSTLFVEESQKPLDLIAKQPKRRKEK